jgi:uncharacterized protein (DUF1330 family)
MPPTDLTRRAAIAGLAAAATLSPLQAARADDLPGYLIVVGRGTDPAKMGAYARSLPPIYAATDGYYLSIGAKGRGVRFLKAPWDDRSVVLARFSAYANVDRFWWGDAYRASVRLREGAGAFSVWKVRADAPTPHEGPEAGFLITLMSPSDAARTQAWARDYAAAVTAAGGAMMAATTPEALAPLEGDTLFDRVLLASFATRAARDAFLASPAARRLDARRDRAGYAVAVATDGVARATPPPAASRG